MCSVVFLYLLFAGLAAGEEDLRGNDPFRESSRGVYDYNYEDPKNESLDDDAQFLRSSDIPSLGSDYPLMAGGNHTTDPDEDSETDIDQGILNDETGTDNASGNIDDYGTDNSSNIKDNDSGNDQSSDSDQQLNNDSDSGTDAEKDSDTMFAVSSDSTDDNKAEIKQEINVVNESATAAATAATASGPCDETEYGCCPDGQHPAHGPQTLGCCAYSEFGCCPGYKTPSSGPYFQGCDCKSTPYGCCPDRLTPSQGANFSGCGCQYTEFGCCEDQKTQATGPGLQSCGCHTYRNGCCPDGITAAQGPNQEGCVRCSATVHGCCPDELTPAFGPHFEGCGCESSRFGCCLDGTVATGPNHMGCLTIPGENCHLAPERGSCQDYQEKWYYNMEYGGCDRFWYGGCDAGRNHFDSQTSCQKECVAPRGSGVCYLKRVVGPCKGEYLEWFYDINSRSCKQFTYGGCLGNGNRFNTKKECEQVCAPDARTPVCLKPKAEGSCSGDYRRWHFNMQSGGCEEFSYSGCFGNNNRFMRKLDCENSCKHATITRRTERVCSLYLDQGDCAPRPNQTLPRWGYSPYLKRCVPFYFTGCGGNENNFNSLEDCEHVCPTTFSPIITLIQGKEYLLERGQKDAMIPVSIKANPAAEVTWRYRDNTLTGADPSLSILPDASLKFNSVSDFNAGVYTLSASNGIGDPAVETVTVIVHPVFPTLSLDLDKTIYVPGSQVIFTCKIRGYPISGVVWKKKSHRRQEEVIIADNFKLLIETVHDSTLELVSKLTLRDVKDEDTATYICSVNTPTSSPISKSRSISVQYGPGERCVDSITFAKYCYAVVQNRQCSNNYYGRFCCRSCAESGYMAGGRLP